MWLRNSRWRFFFCKRYNNLLCTYIPQKFITHFFLREWRWQKCCTQSIKIVYQIFITSKNYFGNCTNIFVFFACLFFHEISKVLWKWVSVCMSVLLLTAFFFDFHIIPWQFTNTTRQMISWAEQEEEKTIFYTKCGEKNVIISEVISITLCSVIKQCITKWKLS